MERVIVLKNTETGQALTLPVTPSRYPMAAGRAVERLDMAQTGQIALPGLKTLFTGTLEFLLPARQYPFLTAGAAVRPAQYLEQLSARSEAANVCRYIVTGTDINVPVLLGPLEYGENDGTNDVNCKLPLYEYRYLEEAQAEKVTQNAGRPVLTAIPQYPDGHGQRSGERHQLDPIPADEQDPHRHQEGDDHLGATDDNQRAHQ